MTIEKSPQDEVVWTLFVVRREGEETAILFHTVILNGFDILEGLEFVSAREVD